MLMWAWLLLSVRLDQRFDQIFVWFSILWFHITLVNVWSSVRWRVCMVGWALSGRTGTEPTDTDEHSWLRGSVQYKIIMSETDWSYWYYTCPCLLLIWLFTSPFSVIERVKNVSDKESQKPLISGHGPYLFILHWCWPGNDWLVYTSPQELWWSPTLEHVCVDQHVFSPRVMVLNQFILLRSLLKRTQNRSSCSSSTGRLRLAAEETQSRRLLMLNFTAGETCLQPGAEH